MAHSCQRWTEKEERILKDNYSEMPPKEVQKLLPERTYSSVVGKAHSLGISEPLEMKQWENQEIKLLKQLYKQKTATEIAEMLNRTKKSVRWKASHLCLQKQTTKKPPRIDFETKLCRQTIIEKLAKNDAPPYKQWTPVLTDDMFYILGVIKGDGTVCIPPSRRGHMYTIRLVVADEVFAREFEKSIENIGLQTQSYKRSKENRKEQTAINTQSKAFLLWYQELTYKWLLDADPQHLYSFMKGIFESDGNYEDDKKTTKTRIRVVEKELAITTYYIWRKLGYNPTYFVTKLQSGRDYYNITLNRQDEVRHFLKTISPCIERKRWKNEN